MNEEIIDKWWKSLSYEEKKHIFDSDCSTFYDSEKRIKEVV